MARQFIILRSTEDQNATQVLEIRQSDDVPLVLQLAVAKKAGMLPERDDQGRVKVYTKPYESDGRPAGYPARSAFLR